ncbi:hypothetical protein PSN13_02086 [Micromonospora saelicesensis]|uniref:Uncharacterized protein n=1 Tax=Micromonospora saelicesensis TaxID=285676 RepID=A0A328NWU6_9ACTN|nr:hypothetical protein [Micromonospora saelicesensis]RAO36084.1 hypothetical protein PSN13_02086 [Micromonospora saelicesensis]
MSKRAVHVVLALSVVLMVTGIVLRVAGDGGADTVGTVAVSLASVGSIVASIGSSFGAARGNDGSKR